MTNATDDSVNQLDKILPALRAARTAMEKIGVSGHNKFDDYDYSSMKDFAEGVEAGLRGNGLSVVVNSVTPEYFSTGRDKLPSGCRVMIAGRIYHDSGQFVSFAFPGEAYDRGDKALYKAITGARKYALACLFNLKAGTDPEGDERVSQDVAPPAGNPYRRQTLGVVAAPAAVPAPHAEYKPLDPARVKRAPTAELLGKAMMYDYTTGRPITADNWQAWHDVAEAADLFASAQVKAGVWKETDLTPVLDALDAVRTNPEYLKAKVGQAGQDAFG